MPEPSRNPRDDRGGDMNLVRHVGAMSNVMHRGLLSASIRLEELTPEHLFAVGPVENLRGEITIVDGNSFVATLDHSESESVAQTLRAGAPFLVYANVTAWSDPEPLTSVANLAGLERAVADAATGKGMDLNVPFPFWIRGAIRHANYHVIWRDPGEGPHSPERHAKAKKYFSLAGEASDIIGFFSRHHAGIFTHHDSMIHAHIINHRRTRMGHLDDIAVDMDSATILFPSAVGTTSPS